MKYTTLSTEGYENLMNQYGMSELVAKVCAARKLSHEQIEELTQSGELSDPFAANGLHSVIKRIQAAAVNKEKVLVCGDYDADGICATTILYDALRRYGIQSGFYIPNRFQEGYGLHPHTVEMAKEKGYSLLITVDNGVKAQEALKRCKELGITSIVSDHHTIEDDVDCDLLLHPQLMGEPFHYMCGAAVALMISRALLGEVKEHVVLAAIASIADVMPLWRETRKIVRLGIIYLREGYCLPIQCLCHDAHPNWDERLIAFQIVPKLNSTGRLADLVNVNNTVRYLLLKERKDILPVAAQIEALNQHRRTLSTKMSEFAKTKLCLDQRFLVLADEQFHEGLIGIIAGKLCEEYHRPVAVFALDGEIAKGSVRSCEEVDLRPLFAHCPVDLLAYGGHKAAAGISLSVDKLPQLSDYLQEQMNTLPRKESEYEEEVISITMAELQIDTVAELEHLAPFGEGFRKPLFCIEDFHVQTIRELSQGKHVKWESLEHVEALYFNARDVYAKYHDAKQLTFFGHLAINTFRHEKKVNILVSDVIS